MKYYYGLQNASEAGVKEHPQAVILRLAPDAHAFRPESLGDCWFFEASKIEVLPSYVLPCGPDGVPLWEWHTNGCGTANALRPDGSWSEVVIRIGECVPIQPIRHARFSADKWGLCTCCQLLPKECLGHPWNDNGPYCETCGQSLCECAELLELQGER